MLLLLAMLMGSTGCGKGGDSAQSGLMVRDSLNVRDSIEAMALAERLFGPIPRAHPVIAVAKTGPLPDTIAAPEKVSPQISGTPAPLPIAIQTQDSASDTPAAASPVFAPIAPLVAPSLGAVVSDGTDAGTTDSLATNPAGEDSVRTNAELVAGDSVPAAEIVGPMAEDTVPEAIPIADPVISLPDTVEGDSLR